MPQELVTRNHLTDSSRKSPMGLAKRLDLPEVAVASRGPHAQNFFSLRLVERTPPTSSVP